MALLRYNNWAEASGSVNGTTYSRNRSGNYARNRSTPVNPSAPRQSVIRSIMASLSHTWRNVLTPAQRGLWNDYALTLPALNKIGESITLTGINAFIQLNTWRVARLAIAPVNVPPAVAPSASASLNSIVLAGNSVAIDVTVTMTAYPATATLVVQLSRPQSPGITSIKSITGWQDFQRAVVAGSAPQTVTIPQPIGTYHMAARVFLVDTATGIPIWSAVSELSVVSAV